MHLGFDRLPTGKSAMQKGESAPGQTRACLNTPFLEYDQVFGLDSRFWPDQPGATNVGGFTLCQEDARENNSGINGLTGRVNPAASRSFSAIVFYCCRFVVL